METVFGVILGTGVGGGIVIGGRLLIKANAIAGEWGHNQLPWPTLEESSGRDAIAVGRGVLRPSSPDRRSPRIITATPGVASPGLRLQNLPRMEMGTAARPWGAMQRGLPGVWLR
jgi:hypothetical protein